MSIGGKSMGMDGAIRGGVHTAQQHDSAIKHVTGRAEYADDITEPMGTLHAYLGLSEAAHAEIVSIDLEAVRTAPGVVDVLVPAPGRHARHRRLPTGSPLQQRHGMHSLDRRQAPPRA